MTGIAVAFLLSLVLVWGVPAASAIALSIRPERRSYPPDMVDDPRVGHAPIEHNL